MTAATEAGSEATGAQRPETLTRPALQLQPDGWERKVLPQEKQCGIVTNNQA